MTVYYGNSEAFHASLLHRADEADLTRSLCGLAYDKTLIYALSNVACLHHRRHCRSCLLAAGEDMKRWRLVRLFGGEIDANSEAHRLDPGGETFCGKNYGASGAIVFWSQTPQADCAVCRMISLRLPSRQAQAIAERAIIAERWGFRGDKENDTRID
jgi:hypothetical protein